MLKTKKLRCWVCGSLDVIKWGVRNGKQRFRCKDCGALNTRKNQGVSCSNRFIWFREWITGKQTFSQLSARSGYSERSLKYYFYDYLSPLSQMENPSIRESKLVNRWHLF